MATDRAQSSRITLLLMLACCTLLTGAAAIRMGGVLPIACFAVAALCTLYVLMRTVLGRR